MTAHNVETETSRAVTDRPYSFACPFCFPRIMRFLESDQDL